MSLHLGPISVLQWLSECLGGFSWSALYCQCLSQKACSLGLLSWFALLVLSQSPQCCSKLSAIRWGVVSSLGVDGFGFWGSLATGNSLLAD